MKMGKTTKIAALVMTGILAVQTGAFADNTKEVYAYEGVVESVQPRLIAIDICDCDLTINSSLANCYGKTEVSPNYTAKTVVTLQKKGLAWSDVKTWTKTSSTTKAIVDEDYVVTSGTYRLKVTHYAMSGSTVVESYTSYSTEVTK